MPCPRRFKDGDDVEAKSSEFRNSPGFQALGDRPRNHIAKMEIQTWKGLTRRIERSAVSGQLMPGVNG